MYSILAARTDFSIGESILHVDKLIEEAKAVNAKAIMVNDTMSVTALIDFTRKAQEAKIKPIIGVRIRLSDDCLWRPEKGEKKADMPRTYFLTLVARTEEGLKAIFRLLTLGNDADHFYYVSKVGFDELYNELSRIKPDDLAVVLGDTESVLAHSKCNDIIKAIKSHVDLVFSPLVLDDTPYFGRMNEIAIAKSIEFDLPLIAIRPAFYAKGEADAQEIMAAICLNQKITDSWFRSRFQRDFHVMGELEFVKCATRAAKHLQSRNVTDAKKHVYSAIQNTDKLVDSVSYVWKKADISLPQMAPNEFKAVTDECVKGWKKRFSDNEIFGYKPSDTDLNTVYKERLLYELSVLRKLQFSGYFLLVQDIVQFAKSNNILVGPGRGSVGGSLVAYLMGITDCDPIRFGLLFERFINPDRIDLPDADLDFMSERRHEVVEYIVNKYGKERVAGVSNFGTLAAASSIRDVGRVAGIPEKDYSVSKFVPKLHGATTSLADCREQVGEIDNFASKYDGYWGVMEQLEGTIRNMSQHAAGIVIAACDLTERAVVEQRKDTSAVCWDKRVVEDQGLIKVDLLGLRTLDQIKLTLDYIEERTGERPDLSAISLTDDKVLENFAKANTTGIFQFESGGMRRLLKNLGADGEITFTDISAATALYRPGPMESGMMDSFWKRKQGTETIDYDHPLMEPILEETNGVIVYQEQVMQIARTIAGYSAAEADKLRKIMGKKLPEEMAKERDKFIQGCVATIGVDERWAGRLFDKIEGFAGYGFNKSHSVEYTLISYQVMWLKTYHAIEFYAAALSLLDEDKLPHLIRDAKLEGIDVSMPDINISTNRFEIATSARLVMPLQRIKGLSIKTVDAILEARKAGAFKNKSDFLARVEKRRCNSRHQDALDRVGAFARIELTQAPANDPSRIKDQMELLPGLIASYVPINHAMNTDKDTKTELARVIDDYRTKFGPGSATVDGQPIKPFMGKTASFMIIADAPTNSDEVNGVLGVSMSSAAVLKALDEAGLTKNDVYWTSLLKRPKASTRIEPNEVQMYSPYLEQEIDLLRPPVIVLLGSNVTRHFIPDFKGKASDQAGKVVYSDKYDCNLVIAFSPGEIFHDSEKQSNMNDVFIRVAELLA